MTGPLVIGLGSHQGDDQAGWLIVDRLHELGYPSARLQKAQHPADLLDDIDRSRSLLVCDACQGPSPVGTIHYWQWPTDSLLTLRSPTTHDLGLSAALELAVQLERCPDRVEIWAVEGREWSPGTMPGDEVRAAASVVAETIWRKHHNA